MTNSEKIKRLTRILNALNGKDDAMAHYFDSAGVTLDGMMQNYSDNPTMKIFPQDLFTDEQIEKIEGMMEKDGLLKKEEKPKMKVWQWIAITLLMSANTTEETVACQIRQQIEWHWGGDDKWYKLEDVLQRLCGERLNKAVPGGGNVRWKRKSRPYFRIMRIGSKTRAVNMPTLAMTTYVI